MAGEYRVLRAGPGPGRGAVSRHHHLPCLHPQSCPRLHSCSLSVPPGTLATGQFPTRPPPSGPCSCCPSPRVLTASRRRAGAVPAPRFMLGPGRASCPGLSFPVAERVGKEPGLEPRASAVGWLGAYPHESLNPWPCPSLGDSGGQGRKGGQGGQAPNPFLILASGATLLPRWVGKQRQSFGQPADGQ